MFYQKFRDLIMDEKDVTTVLAVINRNQGFFSLKDKRVDTCGWKDDPGKWFVGFYASRREWGRIATELGKLGTLNVKISPAGTTNLCFTRIEL